MKKKALVVALAEYKNSKNNLKGVHRDVPSIMSVLSRFGIHDVQVVRDKMATADGIRTALNQLVLGLEEGDHAVFYYSGHGFRLQPSLSTGSGETDGRDEALVPWEGDLGSLIRDDWMEAFLRTKLHAKANFWGVYDACHSGTMYKALELDGVPNSYSQSKELQIENLEFTTFPSGFGKMVSGVKSLVLDDSALHAVHLAAAKEEQTALCMEIEGEARSVFTYAFEKSAIPGVSVKDFSHRVTEVMSNVTDHHQPVVTASEASEPKPLFGFTG